MSVVLDGYHLTIEDVHKVACEKEKVEIHPDAVGRIEKCRAMLDKKINAHEIMYGVNTGIGEFSEIALSRDQVQAFQRFLVYNHAAGIGDPMPEEYVRAAMTTRINVHAHGHSGLRPVVTETLCRMLNAGVTPVVCEGEAFYRGERLHGT